MKTILTHLSFLLLTIGAFAQGPSPMEWRGTPDHEMLQIAPLSDPGYFPEAAEYAFSVTADPATQRISIRVNAAPEAAHARLTDWNGNLVHYLPQLEVDRRYVLPELESGVYLLRFDTGEYLPAGSFRIVQP